MPDTDSTPTSLPNPISPDPIPPHPIAVAPGTATTEFTLTKALIGIGALLATGSQLLGALPEPMRSSKWASIAGTIAGAGIALLTALGYIRSRTEVKTSAHDAVVSMATGGGGESAAPAAPAAPAASAASAASAAPAAPPVNSYR